MNDNKQSKSGIEATQDSTVKTGKAMMYVGWLLVLAMLTWYFNNYEANKNNPNQDPLSFSSGQQNVVTLKRNEAGHYVTTGTINGEKVTFLLDTGATNVSIPEKLSSRLHLEKLARGQSNTANGYVDVFITRINKLTIGNIEVTDVPASINPGQNYDNQILLGMSVLKNVEFTQKGDELTLKQFR